MEHGGLWRWDDESKRDSQIFDAPRIVRTARTFCSSSLKLRSCSINLQLHCQIVDGKGCQFSPEDTSPPRACTVLVVDNKSMMASLNIYFSCAPGLANATAHCIANTLVKMHYASILVLYALYLNC
ncbi:hypothetical protein AgCh_018958 [Apium graveolens]